ncbi:MAG: DoxX family protein [Candidatus Sulfotelmatobacter sp.]
MKLPKVLGRVVFGGFFLYNGIHHFMERKAMAQYVDAKGIPMPDVAVTATGVALTLGGASIALGIKPELGAVAVASFLAGVSPMMHDFWKVEDPQKRQSEMISFSKNMALLGAALVLMGAEDGKRHCR